MRLVCTWTCRLFIKTSINLSLNFQFLLCFRVVLFFFFIFFLFILCILVFFVVFMVSWWVGWFGTFVTQSQNQIILSPWNILLTKKLFILCLDDKKPVSVFLNKFKWSQSFFS